MAVGSRPDVLLAVAGLVVGLAVADARAAALLAVCGFFAGKTARCLWRTLGPGAEE